ncbi:MAG: hypothetical protein CL607_22575 [Anaerolineaceae bacterium]|nr:hypothetical protein [Anaerolineaceae bacterium]
MSISGNALVMKEININLVRKTLKAKREATKHQIAQATGLSTVTVATMLQELVDNNEAFEAGLAASMGGRPAQLFHFNENHAHVLVLFTHEQDGLDRLYIRVADLFGTCIHAVDVPLAEITLTTFEAYIDQAMQEYPSIKAIGLGLPGVVLDGTFITGDYQALVGAPLLPHYEARYDLPVLFANDVNAATVGYVKRVDIDAGDGVVYFYFPQKYPPGAGFYLDGKLYKGYRHHAGEITQLPFDVNWRDSDLYRSPEQVSEAISELIIMTSSLLNPRGIVLYGSFLTDLHIRLIQDVCRTRLLADAMPAIHLTQDFTQDYEIGMIQETLALLEPQISISL